MLTVTDSAAAQLDTMLSDAPEGAAIRFVPNGNVLEPRLDEPREGDAVYKHGERVVLIVEPNMAEALSDRVLDSQSTEQGERLTLKVVEGESGESSSQSNSDSSE